MAWWLLLSALVLCGVADPCAQVTVRRGACGDGWFCTWCTKLEMLSSLTDVV